jgi:hypothetical protein
VSDQQRLLELRIQDKFRSAFITTFVGAGESGALVLSAIANQCGANEFDPNNIKPELVALWNWILSMLGLRGDVNVNLTSAKAYQDYIQEMKALLPLSNMNDVTQELSQIGGTDGDGTSISAG